MSCFILTATPPPKRFCPSWDLNTPSLKGSATSSLGVSKWCLSLISWNIPELSDSKLLWGGTVRKFPNLQAALGVTPVRPLLVRRETAPRPLGISAKLWGCHLTSQGNHILFSTFVHHCLPHTSSSSGYNSLPLVNQKAGQPTPLTGDRTNHEHSPPPRPQLNSQPTPRGRGGEGRRHLEPQLSGQGAHRLTDKLCSFTAPGGNKIRGSSESFSVANRIENKNKS